MSPYTPDPRPRIQAATRFFARLLSFDLECPHCGSVYTIRTGFSRRLAKAQPFWDPWTGRFSCTNKMCARVYVLGILAWPIAAAPRVATQTPSDQVPHPRQLAQMRAEGGGWWMPEKEAITLRRPQETNLTTEPDRPEED